MLVRQSSILLVVLGLAACATPVDPYESFGDVEGSILEGKADGVGSDVLCLVNRASESELDDDARLDRRAARGILLYRAGADGTVGTDDDRAFESLAELDAIPYVGRRAFERLAEYAATHPCEPEQEHEDGAVCVANTLTQEQLDDDVGLDARAAERIIIYRSGDDRILGTDDDILIVNRAELDSISFVGDSALGKMQAWADEYGCEAPVDSAAECLSNTDCGSGERCRYTPDVACGTPGRCVVDTVPTGCPINAEAVCGCDGRTYQSFCHAEHRAGVAIAYSGECGTSPVVPAPEPEPMDCRGNDDCASGEYCVFPESLTCDALASGAGTGSCEPAPEVGCSLLARPVCGCDGESYGNRCQAERQGVLVASEGACESDFGNLGDSCSGFGTCADGLFCAIAPTSSCGDAPDGFCLPLPETCEPDDEPACGCSGVQYESMCVLLLSGDVPSEDRTVCGLGPEPNECGEIDPPDVRVRHTTSFCISAFFTCAEGTHYFSDACGCGCRDD